MVDVVTVETGLVLIVKVPVVVPAGIFTLNGAVALALLEPKLTLMLPLGAGAVSVTVPTTLTPPNTDKGETETDAIPRTLTPIVCFSVTPL